MKLITGFLFKNWSAILLFSVLAGAWAFVKIKNNTIEEQAAVIEKQSADNELLASALDSALASASLSRRELVAARDAIRRDSLDCVRTVQGVQSVVSAMQKERVKLRNENEYLRENPVRIDLIEYRLNVFGRKKDSTYTESWKWVKD